MDFLGKNSINSFLCNWKQTVYNFPHTTKTVTGIVTHSLSERYDPSIQTRSLFPCKITHFQVGYGLCLCKPILNNSLQRSLDPKGSRRKALMTGRTEFSSVTILTDPKGSRRKALMTLQISPEKVYSGEGSERVPPKGIDDAYYSPDCIILHTSDPKGSRRKALMTRYRIFTNF